MTTYFNEFTSYHDRIDNAKSFNIVVNLRSNGPNNRVLHSSAIPNTRELREAVMAAIAMTAPAYNEPLMMWCGRSMEVIPADSIESVRIEFDLAGR